MNELPLILAPLRCPACARSDEQAITALVVDGPGVCYEQVAIEQARAGDVCSRCPRCGATWCVRVIRKTVLT